MILSYAFGSSYSGANLHILSICGVSLASSGFLSVRQGVSGFVLVILEFTFSIIECGMVGSCNMMGADLGFSGFLWATLGYSG